MHQSYALTMYDQHLGQLIKLPFTAAAVRLQFTQ